MYTFVEIVHTKHLYIKARGGRLVMIERFEELIDGYMQNSVGVSQQFLPEDLSWALSANLEQLYVEGQTVLAGVGSAENKIIETAIRRDKIFWISPTTTDVAELRFIKIIEEFISHLNSTCYTCINDYEFHYAVYEEGSFYKKHRDQFKNNSGRKFSFVTYLNSDWKEEDGGQILLYKEQGGVQAELPIFGKTVFFRSDDLEHEVLPVKRKRLSVVGWLKSI